MLLLKEKQKNFSFKMLICNHLILNRLSINRLFNYTFFEFNHVPFVSIALFYKNQT